VKRNDLHYNSILKVLYQQGEDVARLPEIIYFGIFKSFSPRLFSPRASDFESNRKLLAAKKKPKDMKIVMQAIVNARDFPCHNPTNQSLKPLINNGLALFFICL